MPDVRMPNGTVIQNVPAGITQAQLLDRLRRNNVNVDTLLKPAPALVAEPAQPQQEKPEGGFISSFVEGVQTLGLADEAAAYAANPTDENRRRFLEKAESKYKQYGFGEGKNLKAFLQMAGASLGQLVAPVGAGIGATAATAATVAGAPVSPFVGIGAAGAASGSQYTIQNLLRQAQEQEGAIAKGQAAKPVDVGKALIAATGQAGLDLVGGKVFAPVAKMFPFMAPLMKKEGAAMLEEAVKKGTVKFSGEVAKGVAGGAAFEVPQEVAQQAIERWQAGLSLTDDEARSEYVQAAIGAAALGGVYGGVSGTLAYGAKRGAIDKAGAQEEEAAAAEPELSPEVQDAFATGYARELDKVKRANPGISDEDAEAQVDQMAPTLLDRAERLVKGKERAAAKAAAAAPDAGGGEPSAIDAGVGVAGADVGSVPVPDVGGVAGAPEVGGQPVPGGVVGNQPVASQPDAPEGTQPPPLRRATEEELSQAEDEDALYTAAQAHVIGTQSASVPALQKALKVPHQKAKELIGQLESDGVVSPISGGRRKVLAAPEAAPIAEPPTINPNPEVPAPQIAPVEEAAPVAAPPSDAKRAEMRESVLRDLLGEAPAPKKNLSDMPRAERAAAMGEAPVEPAVDKRADLPPHEVLRYDQSQRAEPIREDTRPAPVAAAPEQDAQMEALRGYQAPEDTEAERRARDDALLDMGNKIAQYDQLRGNAPLAVTEIADEVIEDRKVAAPNARAALGLEEGLNESVTIDSSRPVTLNDGSTVYLELDQDAGGYNIDDPFYDEALLVNSGVVTPEQNEGVNIPTGGKRIIGKEKLAALAPRIAEIVARRRALMTQAAAAALNSRQNQAATDVRTAPNPSGRTFQSAMEQGPEPLPEPEAPKLTLADADERLRPAIKKVFGKKLDSEAAQQAIELSRTTSLPADVFEGYIRKRAKSSEGIVTRGEPGQKKVSTFHKPNPVSYSVGPESWADDTRERFAGEIVYQEDNYALVRGQSANGDAVYLPVILTKDGEVFFSSSGIEEFVDGDKGIPKEDAFRLFQMMIRAENKDEDAYRKQPNGPFSGEQGQVVTSDSLDPKLGEFAQALLRSMGLGRLRVFIATPEDVYDSKAGKINPKYGLNSFFGSARYLANKDRHGYGSMRKFGPENKDFVIGLMSGRTIDSWSAQLQLETLTHEIGHIVERVMFENAPANVKAAVKKDFEAWLQRVKGVSAVEHVQSMRTEAVAEQLTDATSSQMRAYEMDNYSSYWLSFSEWFADQTARWATTSEKPVSLVEKFFSELAARLRNLVARLRGIKAPGYVAPSMEEYLNGLKETDAEAWFNTDFFGQPNPIQEAKKAKASKPKAPKPQLSEEQRARALEMAKKAARLRETKVGTVQKKITASRDAKEQLGNLSDLMRVSRDGKQDFSILNAMVRAASGKLLRNGILPNLTTDDISRLGAKFFDIAGEVAGINDAAEAITVSRTREINRLEEKAAKFTRYMEKSSTKAQYALADAMHATRYLNVDPTKAPTAEAYAARVDEAAKTFRAAGQKMQLAVRTKEIEEAYKYWKDVSPEGREMYAMVRDEYKRNLDRQYELVMARIDDTIEEGNDRKEAKSYIESMFAEARKAVVYFPLMRYGNYWVSVGKGAKGEFHMFESEVAKEVFEAKMKAKHGAENVDSGDDINALRKHMQREGSASDAFKKVMDILDAGKNDENIDLAILRDGVMQMYLQALPEADMRRKFIHYKFKTGFDSDVLRNFRTTQMTAATQLARLENQHLLRNAVSAAKENLSDSAKLGRDVKFAMPIIEELALRANQELAPPSRNPNDVINLDRVGAFGNKLVFYYMMTSPMSALTALTQLPIVGLPVLASKYGYRRTSAMAAKYMAGIGTGKQLTFTKRAEDGEIITRFGDASLMGSKYMEGMKEKNPTLYNQMKKAWEFANDRSLFMSTFQNDINDQVNTPSSNIGVIRNLKEGRTGEAAMQAAKKGIKMMGALFQQAERTNREVMFMSAFELGYADNIKKGMDPDAAGEAAMRDAYTLTDEGLFKFTYYNRPRSFKQFRLGTQFLMFPMQMLSLLIRNASKFIPMLGSVEERKAARKMLFGVTMMAGMFAGATGATPLTGLIAATLRAAMEAMDGDDDDPSDPANQMDPTFWFTTKFIPETFGPGSTVANAFGLSDEAAELLARSIQSGPISALTDVNIAASTSLNGLIFTSEPQSSTTQGKLAEFAAQTMLGPSWGFAKNMARGVEFFQEGKTDRALEMLTPAFFRGALTADRLAREGLVTGDGTPVMDKEFYTTAKLFKQALGMRSTEAANIQKENVEVSQRDKGIQAQKNLIKERYVNAMVRSINNPSPENDAKAMRILTNDVFKFMEQYPLAGMDMGYLGEAVSNELERNAASIKGLTMNPKDEVSVYVAGKRIDAQ